jgi:glycosyltransferase involved in cell wall biosynthesis
MPECPPFISLLIPIHNEEDNIGNTLRIVRDEMPQITPHWEVVVVESGSSDASLEIVQEEAGRCRNIRYVHQPRREGMGSALRAGYRLCRGEWVCHLEADMPFDISYLAEACEYFKDYDFIRGYRTSKRDSILPWVYSRDNMLETLLRAIFHHGYRFYVGLLFGKFVRDINFSFKVIRREKLDQVNLTANGWFIDTELYLELVKAGARIKVLPITYNMRENGTSTVTYVSPFPIMKDAFHYRRTRWK